MASKRGLDQELRRRCGETQTHTPLRVLAMPWEADMVTPSANQCTRRQPGLTAGRTMNAKLERQQEKEFFTISSRNPSSVVVFQTRHPNPGNGRDRISLHKIYKKLSPNRCF